MCYLGFALRDGLGVSADARASVEWFERAAERDDASATFELARCYADGLGVEIDLQRAVDTCAQAARLGHAAAQYELGLVIEHIDGRDAETFARALAWYRAAAERGHAEAQQMVDYADVIEGAIEGHAENQVFLARAFRDGATGRKDFEAARHWYEAAHEQGDQQASLALGKLLIEGGETVTLLGRTSFEPDHLAAVSALDATAGYGNVEARTLLAQLHADRTSPAYDLERAVDWCNLAAASGDFTSVPVVQAEVDRVASAELSASFESTYDASNFDASDTLYDSPCGFCGGAGVVISSRGHYVGSHYWPDTYSTCLECNGTGSLWH
jgi:uncharacterized protein